LSASQFQEFFFEIPLSDWEKSVILARRPHVDFGTANTVLITQLSGLAMTITAQRTATNKQLQAEETPIKHIRQHRYSASGSEQKVEKKGRKSMKIRGIKTKH
jgi:hypothetical protein